MDEAIKFNINKNDKKADWITASWICLIIGIFLMVIYVAIYIAVGTQDQPHSAKDSNATITSTGQILYELFPQINKETIERLYPGIGDDDNKLIFFNDNNNSQLYQAGVPWMDIDYQWFTDDLVVHIVVDSTSMAEKQTYAIEAINEWSNLLKEHSGNASAWNFKILLIDEDNVQRSQPADISVILRDEPNPQRCSHAYGEARSFHDDSPQYALIYTTCGGEIAEKQVITSTLLHEFAHTLGLGHAYNKDRDLMCSVDSNNSDTCSVLPDDSARPSTFDIDTFLYMYGNDGFGGKNPDLRDKPYFIYETHKITKNNTIGVNNIKT